MAAKLVDLASKAPLKELGFTEDDMHRYWDVVRRAHVLVIQVTVEEGESSPTFSGEADLEPVLSNIIQPRFRRDSFEVVVRTDAEAKLDQLKSVPAFRDRLVEIGVDPAALTGTDLLAAAAVRVYAMIIDYKLRSANAVFWAVLKYRAAQG